MTNYNFLRGGRRLRPYEAKRSLRHRFPGYPVTVEEYIRECEHQEGRRFWGDNFANLNELADDFVRYATARGAMQS